MPYAPGATLSHYMLLEKIGQGGMGVVFRARDTTLRREVALKVLPAALVGDRDRRQRFLREARAAAAVNHPRIAAIYEAGESHGEMYLAMELVRGSSLRALLRDGPLPLAQALALSAEVADALSCAHDARIVHRDLKPENIMVDGEGRAKVLDFGLAKVLETTGDGSFAASQAETFTQEVTRQGGVLGTPPYMSPEQARGERADLRTDLFSLGATLYEMTTGRVPFSGKSPLDTLAAVVSRAPTPPSEIEHRIPPAVERLILRCLEKEPDQRYQTAAELARDLRSLRDGLGARRLALPPAVRRRIPWLLAVGVVLLLAGLLVSNAGGVRDRLAVLLLGPRLHSLAVLPLENLSGDPSQDYFADGITESLIGKLGEIGSLNVISRTSVMRFRDSSLSLPEIAASLNVDAVVEGSVARVGNRVGITVRLVDARRDRLLWSQHDEHDLLDVLLLRNQVARSLAREIRAELTPDQEARLATASQVSPEAFDLYLRGRYRLAGEYSGLAAQEAMESFQRAIDLAPDFALAHAAVAEIYARITTRYTPEESVEKGRAAAREAMRLDEGLGIAYAALGKIKYQYEWDWSGAGPLLEQAQRLDPANLTVLQFHAMYHLLSGESEEGVALSRRVAELDPLTPASGQQYALGLAWAERWDESLREFDRVLALLEDSPNPAVEWGVHYQRSYVNLFSGRLEEARADIDAAKLGGEKIWLAILEGDRQAGIDEMDRLRGLPAQKAISLHAATVYALMGEVDEGIETLEAMVEAGHPMVAWINVHPGLAPLRDDPRFDEIRRRVGFS